MMDIQTGGRTHCKLENEFLIIYYITGLYAAQLAQKERSGVNIGQFTLSPSNRPLHYGGESGKMQIMKEESKC